MALQKEATFILQFNDKNKFAVSWWVSAKRTRSYPYARVYNSLSFAGKKITIIPIFKDEGKDGDRDFLQWDTISLMSLLGVYAIISYYVKANKSPRYKNKITNQRFNAQLIIEEMNKLLSYQSDALHWNLEQIEKVGKIGQQALLSYKNISKKLHIKMHSETSAQKKVDELLKGKEQFMSSSRSLAKKAQSREKVTIQPKEFIKAGDKAILTIKNYLGGYYYFTADEAKIIKDNVHLIEAKHSAEGRLPALDDIRDGLLKMILFTNLKNLKIKDKRYKPKPTLKLSTGYGFNRSELSASQKKICELLKSEAESNGFSIQYI